MPDSSCVQNLLPLASGSSSNQLGIFKILYLKSV